MFDMDYSDIDNLTKAYEAEIAPPHIIKNKSLLPMKKKQDSEKRDDCPGDDFPVTEILTQSRQERKVRQSRWKAKTLKNWIKKIINTILSCP